MNKFIIVDHSLCNLQGHHYECSVSVAEAAARQGYQPIIIANRTFPKELSHPNIKIIPSFEVDWFNNPVNLYQSQSWRSYLQKFVEFLNGQPVRKLYKKTQETIQLKLAYWNLTQPKLRLFLEKVQGSTLRLWSWINKDIELLRSIPLSNTVWGIIKIIWGLFRFILNLVINKINQKLLKLLTPKTTSFRATLEEVLKNIKATPEDQVFIHTIGIEQVEELYHLLTSDSFSVKSKFHIMLRRDIEDSLVINAKGIGLKRILEQFYESQLWPERIKFYTDTEDLVQRHNTLSPIIFGQIPIPFRQEKLKQFTRNTTSSKPINIVYLGDARPEKGYQHLPSVIDALWTDYVKPEKIKFTIQSNFNIDGGIGDIPIARLKLETYPSDKVSLIKEAMSPDDYYQLLVEADLLILPYDANSYRIRTSGVLTEALAAGKPVVVPANSWLAKQVDSSRAVSYGEVNEIPKSIIKIIENLASFTEAAQQFSCPWKEKNSPDSLVKFLLKKPNIYPKDIKLDAQNIDANLPSSTIINYSVTKILLIVEGDCLLEQNFQQKLMVKHIQYLSDCGYEIYGLFFPSNLNSKKENFDNFTAQLNQVITEINQDISLTQTCIVNYSITNSIPHQINPEQYIQDVYHNQSSLERDLVERYNLDIPPYFRQLLETSQFDLIFINSIASWSIIDKFSLNQLPIICEFTEILSYQYALNNHRDISPLEYQLECQLLNQCNALLVHHDYELEKIREKVHNPQAYILPFEQKRELNKLSHQKYFSLMDEIFVSLLEEKASIWKQGQKKIAILYPWGDILERKSGASKRVGLLIDYLKLQSYNIWVFTTGTAQDFRQDNIHYTYYQQSHAEYYLVKNIYADAYKSWSNTLKLTLNNQNNLSQTIDELNHWLPWIYYQYRFDKDFIEEIEKLAEWADVIILEYPFWALTVADICRQYQTKLIITAHDILCEQLDLSTISGKIALAEEIEGLKQADHLICVSLKDRDFLTQYGLNPQVIPNPVDLDFDKFINNGKEISKKYPKSLLNLTDQPFCLFVGSQHPPNLEAVQKIRQIAQDFLREYPDLYCNFIVVGSCCPKEYQNNFFSLGKVDNQLLSFLYQQASLIISPLLKGTGTSLKIMEAMAYGKVIIGTNIAFRGYPVKSEQDAIICDQLTDYPKQIAKIITTPEKARIIGENATQLAQDYDYRHLYSLYKELIEF
ncbi:MAG TPA: glycosyl transferase family 1 [Cyanothece sp. UBA12306]|nr:glycosyl transferase family 1 [Cyanothece sp. UBA12306]